METAPTRQVFRRMMILTLILGILIGILVSILVLMLFAKNYGAFLLRDSLVTDKLLPLFGWVVFGGALLLQWRRELLLMQFAASQPTATDVSVPLRVHLYLAYGLMGFGLAGLQLIGIILSWDLYHANWLFIVFIGMLCAWAIAWYLQQRDHRRAAQR